MTVLDRTAIRAALALCAILALAACTGSTPSASPTTTVPPSTAPAASPSAQPAGPLTVELVNTTGNDVAVEIRDDSGLLETAASGTPGDGASVEPYTVVVTNDDPSTLRLTWVGGPCDATDTLAIDATARGLLLVQPECQGDAVALDRVLVLRFSEPIDAASVQAILQDGTDTQGG